MSYVLFILAAAQVCMAVLLWCRMYRILRGIPSHLLPPRAPEVRRLVLEAQLFLLGAMFSEATAGVLIQVGIRH
jgi:hypothetical protein